MWFLVYLEYERKISEEVSKLGFNRIKDFIVLKKMKNTVFDKKAKEN